jgi:hypothetical protein
VGTGSLRRSWRADRINTADAAHALEHAERRPPSMQQSRTSPGSTSRDVRVRPSRYLRRTHSICEVVWRASMTFSAFAAGYLPVAVCIRHRPAVLVVQHGHRTVDGRSRFGPVRQGRWSTQAGRRSRICGYPATRPTAQLIAQSADERMYQTDRRWVGTVCPLPVMLLPLPADRRSSGCA